MKSKITTVEDDALHVIAEVIRRTPAKARATRRIKTRHHCPGATAPPLPQNITCNSVTKLALLSKLARPRPPAMLRMPLMLPPPKGTTHFEISLRRWPSMKKFTPACAIHSTGTSLSQHVSSTPGALEVDPYADAGGTQVAEHAH